MDFGLKVALAVVIFAAGWAGGIIPLLRKDINPQARLLAWGNAFAAGIFLAIGLVHMLSDANGSWSDDLGYGYPWAFAIAGGAFALVLLFEHVIVATRSAHNVVHLLEGAHAPDDVPQPVSPTRSTQTHVAVEALEERPAIYPYVLIVALSVHSIIAGLALGAQLDTTQIWVIFVAIIAHKSSAAFALSVSFVRGGLDRGLSLRLLAAFTLTTPAGVLVGAAVSSILDNRAEIYFDATFTAMAAGTFLYIASLDIIRDEFLHGAERVQKWLLLVVAYGGTSLLALWL
ncbi:MAG: ZIP family metal transporter [Actinomycetota bacterium]